jgi:uncharacterized damage-inducible protein DinB
MLDELKARFDQLEDRRLALIAKLKSLKNDHIARNPGPDSWSILQVVQHVVLGERGMRLTEHELRDNPVRGQLRPGKLINVVREILDRDVPVGVPDASLEPDGKILFLELLEQWDRERSLMADLLDTVKAETCDTVMFSHPAAGPMPAKDMLDLALSHFDYHQRQIEYVSSLFGEQPIQNCDEPNIIM